MLGADAKFTEQLRDFKPLPSQPAAVLIRAAEPLPAWNAERLPSPRAKGRWQPKQIKNGAPAKVDIGDYFKMPNRLFGSGQAAELGASTFLVYAAICDHANRNGALTFKVSDKALLGDTGLAKRTILGARKKL